MSTTTLTLLLTTLAVPFTLAVTWALVHLLADIADSRQLQALRVERRPGPAPLKRG